MNEKWGKKIFLDRWMQPVYTHIIKHSQNHLLHEIGIFEELRPEKPDGYKFNTKEFKKILMKFFKNYAAVCFSGQITTAEKLKHSNESSICHTYLSLVSQLPKFCHRKVDYSRFLPTGILLTKAADFNYFLVRNIWFANAPRWRRLCRWNAPTRHDVISFLGLMHNQNPSNKVLQWALFMKQNLRFRPAWQLSSLDFLNFMCSL